MILEIVLSLMTITAVVLLVLMARKLAEMEADARLQAAVFMAIVAAFKASQWGVETLGDYLDGTDRAIIAQHAYHYLPLEVQRQVTPEQWGGLFAVAYNDAVQLYKRNSALFTGKVEDIINGK